MAGLVNGSAVDGNGLFVIIDRLLEVAIPHVEKRVFICRKR